MSAAPWYPKKRKLTDEDVKFVEEVRKLFGKNAAHVVECLLRRDIHVFCPPATHKQEIGIRALALQMNIELPR